MEKEFDDMLQERLNDAKQIEKAKITNFLRMSGQITGSLNLKIFKISRYISK